MSGAGKKCLKNREQGSGIRGQALAKAFGLRTAERTDP
jgi:hypothetical protein